MEQHTILLVEDDATIREMTQLSLERDGFVVDTAADGPAWLEAFRAGSPDLVLLDVMLPDADGFDILLKMRAHPVLKSVPVIMLTAKATRESVLRGLAGGADGYITKPFEVDSLIKAVSTVLGLPQNPGSGTLKR